MIKLASSRVDQNRNAAPSWSGYIHQGKVGFLVALRQLRQCIENGIENFEGYTIDMKMLRTLILLVMKSKYYRGIK